MNTSNQTRRFFLKKSSASLAWLSLATSGPAWVPASVLGQNPPSDKVVVGIIGLGWRGNDLLRECIKNEHIQIAALADLDLAFLMGRMEFVDTHLGAERKWILGSAWDTLPAPVPTGAPEPYLDYRRLLERSDIDAVLAAVPDHWHARVYLDAMDAGKDVYGEKPLALTIKQGRKVVQKSVDSGRLFQIGLQQRSHYHFQRACELVRNGRLGKLNKIRVIIRGTPHREPVPDAPPPGTLNWDMWLGQAPVVPYNPLRCHVFFRYFFEYSGGQITDLGAHHADIAQWALDMDNSGPQFIEGTTRVKPGAFNTFTDYNLALTYANGVQLTFESGEGFDMIFYGDQGELFVNRGRMQSNPAEILQQPLPDNALRFSKPGAVYASEDESYTSSTFDHIQRWVDSIKSRQRPVTDAEIGHRSTTVCHLANICGWLNRKLEWDPIAEQFVNDPEADTHLDRLQREPHGV